MREAALPLFHVSCDEGYSQLLAGLPRLFTDRRDNITFTYELAELWRRRLLQKLTIVSVACISTEVRDRADRRCIRVADARCRCESTKGVCSSWKRATEQIVNWWCYSLFLMSRFFYEAERPLRKTKIIDGLSRMVASPSIIMRHRADGMTYISI